MAGDHTLVDPGNSPTIPVASDTDSNGDVWQRFKVGFGVDGSPADVTITNGLPVQIISGSIGVTGTMDVDSSHAEDAVHASGDLGAFVLAVRKDTATQLAGTDGDYSPVITDAAGRLWVNVGAAAPAQAATATLANVSGSATSVTLQALNAARKGLVIVNDSTAILYVKFGSAASTTSYTYFLAGSVGGVPATLELPATVYTGIVTGVWASATGNARVTELT